jgi:hypothetical protein
MSVVRFIPSENRLSKAMSGPGGKPMSKAIADAEAGVEVLFPPGVEAIDEALDTILSALAEQGPLTVDMRETVYGAANRINAMAALFGLAGMGKAAWSLCEVLDLLDEDPPSGRPAVETHVHSLKVLRSGALLPEAETSALVAALGRLLEYIRMQAARS